MTKLFGIRKTALAFTAVAGLWSAAGHAEMLLAQATLISGTEASVASFNVPTAGTLTLQLTDLVFPEKLSSLTYALTTATSVVAGLTPTGMTNAGTSIVYNVSGPGMYSAVVAGTVASDSKFNLGMWSLKVDFVSSVPLPASAWLLLSALAGFAVAWRKRPLVSLPARMALST